MSIQSQLDQVLALVRGMPCRCISVAQLGERDPGCDRCQIASKLSAIRAAVGGEAVPVAWLRTLDGKPDWGEDCLYDGAQEIDCGVYPADEGYDCIPLYASPPATVDVGGLRELAGLVDAIRQYGLDTLSGRDNGPDDREWQRDGVKEMTRRATTLRDELAALIAAGDALAAPIGEKA